MAAHHILTISAFVVCSLFILSALAHECVEGKCEQPRAFDDDPASLLQLGRRSNRTKGTIEPVNHTFQPVKYIELARDTRTSNGILGGSLISLNWKREGLYAGLCSDKKRNACGMDRQIGQAFKGLTWDTTTFRIERATDEVSLSATALRNGDFVRLFHIHDKSYLGACDSCSWCTATWKCKYCVFGGWKNKWTSATHWDPTVWRIVLPSEVQSSYLTNEGDLSLQHVVTGTHLMYCWRDDSKGESSCQGSDGSLKTSEGASHHFKWQINLQYPQALQVAGKWTPRFLVQVNSVATWTWGTATMSSVTNSKEFMTSVKTSMTNGFEWEGLSATRTVELEARMTLSTSTTNALENTATTENSIELEVGRGFLWQWETDLEVAAASLESSLNIVPGKEIAFSEGRDRPPRCYPGYVQSASQIPDTEQYQQCSQGGLLPWFKTITFGPQGTANWWSSFDHKGWSFTSPDFIEGIYRNSCNKLYCVEEMKTRRLLLDGVPMILESEVIDWVAVFDKAGYHACPEHSAITGIWRNDCNELFCLEAVKCSRPVQSIYGRVEARCEWDSAWAGSFDHAGVSSCANGGVIAGFYKNNCNELYCIEAAKCCTFHTVGPPAR